MKKSLLALAVAMAAATAAHAAPFVGGYNPALSVSVPGGDGDALLWLYDPTTQNSYVQNLNVTFSQIHDGSAFNNASIALDAAALSSAFGGDYSNVLWGVGVYGGSYVNADYSGTATSNYGYGFATASSLPTTSNLGQLTDTVGQRFNVAQNTYFQGLQSSDVQVALSGAAGYAGSDDWAGYLYSLLGAVNSSAANTSLNFWLASWYGDNYDQEIQASIGKVNLDLTGDTVTFASTAPAVPVPGAAWLLGSALTGLGAVARSRKKKSA